MSLNDIYKFVAASALCAETLPCEGRLTTEEFLNSAFLDSTQDSSLEVVARCMGWPAPSYLSLFARKAGRQYTQVTEASHTRPLFS